MANADANRRDLAVLHPDAGQTRARCRRYSDLGQCFDEQIFQPAQITMQILAAVAQVDDRIAHQLPRSVISRLSAAIDWEKRIREMSGAAQTGLVRRAADGVDRIVFEQE